MPFQVQEKMIKRTSLMARVTLDEAVEELREPPECVTLYLTRPLRRRTKSEVLRASKEILLQLKADRFTRRNSAYG